MKITDTLIEGVVVDTNDPQQMGRLRIWCPSLDGEDYTPEFLPWATYISPFAGHAYDFPAGSGEKQSVGPVAYGMWAIPKKGAFVVVGFFYGDPNRRFYLGSYYPEHSTRSLPAGRNTAGAPVTDTEEVLEPTTSNLNAQFQGNLSASEARTRGAYERQAADQATLKAGVEGYQTGVLSERANQLDSQTYCWVTPGRHALIMQDNPSTGRIRLKTADGTQVILDDANERIYVSTAKGQTWLELDMDGHVHLYAAASVSVTSGEDISLSAKRHINLSAGGNINLGATGWLRGAACEDLSLSADKGLNLTSKAAMNFLAGANLIQTGSNIHLNGPKAAEAPCPVKPEIVPQHEPWTRPASKGKRGKHWKA